MTESKSQKCSRCEKRQPMANFYRRPGGKAFVMCRECVLAQQAQSRRERRAAARDGE